MTQRTYPAGVTGAATFSGARPESRLPSQLPPPISSEQCGRAQRAPWRRWTGKLLHGRGPRAERATCWLELIKHKRAIDVFEGELVRLPAIENRDHGVYLARLAGAYADDGDPDQADVRRRQSSRPPAPIGSARNSAGCARGWSGGVTCR
jgi:hypothetical protein